MKSWFCVAFFTLFLAGTFALQLGASSLEVITCRVGSCGSNSTGALITYPDSGPGYTALAAAQALDYGTLGASAEVSTTELVRRQLVANSYATAFDRLFFSGTSTGTITFDFTVDFSVIFGSNAGYAELYLSEGFPTNSSAVQHVLFFERNGVTEVAPIHALSITKPFAGSIADYLFTLASIINCSTSGSQNVCGGSSSVNALNTLHLSQITIKDISGDIVLAPGVTSQSGFNYSQFLTTSSVPEPATSLTAMTAFGAMLLFRKRFQKQ